jgi:parallel beta-helix repeat protein
VGSSNHNILAGNTVEDHWRGFVLKMGPHDNVFINNTATLNEIGFWLEDSSNNLIYHNNIIDNTAGAFDYTPADNDWYHPDFLEGNYWSDYSGADDGSGTGKHAVSGDGIGDTDLPHPGPDLDDYPYVDEESWR